MIVGQFIESYDRSNEAYEIRKTVFIDEMKCDLCFLEDELESRAYHLLIRNGKKAVGTGRILLGQEECYIGRIAVLKEHRGLSIGDLIVKMLIDKAFRLGIEKVFVYARTKAVSFYQRIGFVVVGDTFVKEGVEVTKMVITEDNIIRICDH